MSEGSDDARRRLLAATQTQLNFEPDPAYPEARSVISRRNDSAKYVLGRFLTDVIALGAVLASVRGGPGPSGTGLSLVVFSLVFSLLGAIRRMKEFRQPLRYLAWWLALASLRGRLAMAGDAVGWTIIPWELIILAPMVNLARRERKLEHLDLRHGDFSGWSFTGLVFEKVDFRHAQFAGAYFQGVTFRNCNLEEIRASGAKFVDCLFSKSRLDQANLPQSLWEATVITDSSLTYANLNGSTFCSQSLVTRSDTDQASTDKSNAVEFVTNSTRKPF